MGLELMTDRYPPITSQTRYPLRHAASLIQIVVLKVKYQTLVFKFLVVFALADSCIF